jgi:heme/copper-type cytochrome/quinol oxidase subunit 2
LADESKSSQFERYLSLGASVVAPITIISALLFYFGYVSSRAQYAYFGIDVDTIGLSTQDYVMRSPQPLLVPLLVLVMIAVALVALHLWVTAWLGRARPERARIVTHRALYIGLVILAAGITLIILYPVLADWPYYNLVTPIIVAVGAGVVAYSWRLVSRLPPQPDALPSPAGSPALRRMGLVLLCVLVAATLFWSTATIAQWSGRGLARQDARHLDDLPRVILDTKERLYITDPFIKETALPASEGQTFRYRYRNLRLLIQGKDRMFLVPDAWSASDSTLVVPLDDSVRVRFQFQNDPP